MRKIVDGLTRESEGVKIPVILFTKGGCQWLEIMADTGADALGLDWSTDLAMARKRVGDRVALQGNLDPAVLYATPEVIRDKVAAVLAAYGKGSGHVFNLGHGITPDVNPEHAGVLVDAVHELSAPYHI
jgi:uroporphyrinogen decarboxylase